MQKYGYVLMLGAVAFLGLLTMGGAAVLPAQSGITKANFDRIESGMTQTEVETILGQPGEVTLRGTVGSKSLLTLHFSPGDGTVTMTLVNGSVANKDYIPFRETLFSEFLHWLQAKI